MREVRDPADARAQTVAYFISALLLRASSSRRVNTNGVLLLIAAMTVLQFSNDARMASIARRLAQRAVALLRTV